MDSQSSQPKGSEDQLEAILQETAALTAALKWARTARLLLFLALLVFVGVTGLLLWNKVNQFRDPKKLQAYGTAATNYLEKNKDRYLKEVELLVDKIRPPLTKAFTDQAQKDMPRYIRALDKERGPFLDNLQAGFQAKLNKRYETLQPTYKKMLKDEFPLVTNAKLHEKMMDNFGVAMQTLLNKYYVEELKTEMDILYDTWDNFQPAAAPQKGDPSVEEQLKARLFELVSLRLMHWQGGAPVR